MKYIKAYEGKKYKPIVKGDYIKIKPTIGKTEASEKRSLGPFRFCRDAIFIAREDGDDLNIQLDWAGDYIGYNNYHYTGYAGVLSTQCLQVLTPEEVKQWKLEQVAKKYNL